MISFNQIPASFCPETMTVYVNDVPVEQNSIITICAYCDAGKVLSTQLMLAGYQLSHGICGPCYNAEYDAFINRRYGPKVADLNTIL